jgi:hypothetical protein
MQVLEPDIAESSKIMGGIMKYETIIVERHGTLAKVTLTIQGTLAR